MKDCDCDDGIGLFVCEKHSTPKNNPLHYALYGKPQRIPKKDQKRSARVCDRCGDLNCEDH